MKMSTRDDMARTCNKIIDELDDYLGEIEELIAERAAISQCAANLIVVAQNAEADRDAWRARAEEAERKLEEEAIDTLNALSRAEKAERERDMWKEKAEAYLKQRASNLTFSRR